jgi:hypothetical protein
MRRILLAALAAASIGGFGAAAFAGPASIVGAHALRSDMVQKTQDRWRDCRDWDRDGRHCRDRDWDEGRWHDWYGPESCRIRGHDRYLDDGRWRRCERDRDDRGRDCRDWDRDGRHCRDSDWDEGRWRDWWGPESCRRRGHDRYLEDGRWHECRRMRY